MSAVASLTTTGEQLLTSREEAEARRAAEERAAEAEAARDALAAELKQLRKSLGRSDE